jgi:hypothetical protein
MLEHTPLQSEDPLPITRENSYTYNKEPKGTLGEIVVTDPRDPFVWLQTEAFKPYEQPSSNGKQLLWFIYRMNGNMPQSETDIKWRDDRDDIEATLKNSSRIDMNVANRYQLHLTHLDAEQAIKEASMKPQTAAITLEKQPEIKLHEPNNELVFAAIIQHLDLISEHPKAII